MPFYHNTQLLMPEKIPLVVERPVLWLDAADTTTIVQSSNLVSSWGDKSGNANHATQPSGSLQPISGTRTINNRNVLDFDGASDYMTGSMTAINGNAATTIFIVCAFDVLNSVLFMKGVSGTNTAIGVSTGGGMARVFQWGGISLNGDAVSTVPLILCATRDASTLTIAVNNNAPASTTPPALNIANNNYFIGCDDTLNQRFNGTMAEIIAYDTILSAQKISAVTSYLSNKWIAA